MILPYYFDCNFDLKEKIITLMIINKKFHSQPRKTYKLFEERPFSFVTFFYHKPSNFLFIESQNLTVVI